MSFEEDLSENRPEELLEKSDEEFADNLIKEKKIKPYHKKPLLSAIKTRRGILESLRKIREASSVAVKSANQKIIDLELEHLAQISGLILASKVMESGEKMTSREFHRILAEVISEETKLVMEIARQRVPIFPLQALEKLREMPNKSKGEV